MATWGGTLASWEEPTPNDSGVVLAAEALVEQELRRQRRRRTWAAVLIAPLSVGAIALMVLLLGK